MTFGLADCRLHVKRQGTVDYVQSNTVKKTYQLRGKIWVAWHMRINILLHRSCNLSQKHAKLKHTLSFLKKAKSIRIEQATFFSQPQFLKELSSKQVDQYSVIYLVDSPLLPVHVFITMLQSVRHMSKYLSLRHSYSKCSSLDTHHSSVYCSFCNRRSLHDIIKKVGPFKHASPFANPFCSLTKEVKSSLQKESTLISAIM